MGIWTRLKRLFRADVAWQELEFFDPRWKQRIAAMARHIGPRDAVLDLGCGRMWLKEFLGSAATYIPCDYQDRGPGTVVCDFNRGQFPDRCADVCFISGCLEYVRDVDWFLDRVAASAPKCVIAYCVLRPDKTLEQRRQNAWQNHLTEEELIGRFRARGMRLAVADGQFMSSFVYVFERAAAVTPAAAAQ